MLDVIVVWSGKEVTYITRFDSFFEPYFSGIRATIDVSQVSLVDRITAIQLGFSKSTNFSIKVELVDRNWDTRRPLYMNKLRQKGDTIALDKSEISIEKDYYVKFSQNTFSENDKAKKCQNYPTDDFNSYKDCDDDFVKYKGPKTLMTVSGEKENIVVTKSTFSFGNFGFLAGHTKSTCFVPCTSTSSFILLGQSRIAQLSVSYIQIAFDEDVKITKTTLIRFDFMESLNFLGSNLGLWPGLGICQLLEWIIFRTLSGVNF